MTFLPSRCFHCRRFTRDSAVCTACRRQTRLKHVWVLTDYDGVAKQILGKYKFHRAKSAHTTIAQAMVEALPDIPSTTLVVPVPSATKRIRTRGYDHAALIAQDVSKLRGLTYSPILARLTQTRQVGTDKKHRISQLKEAFCLKSPDLRLVGKEVLIIDDVTTTGATLDCVAEELYKAGARQINALIFAQKQ